MEDELRERLEAIEGKLDLLIETLTEEDEVEEGNEECEEGGEEYESDEEDNDEEEDEAEESDSDEGINF